MANAFIKTEHLTYTYAEEGGVTASPAVDDLSVEIEGGSHVAVLGHNGSGKSTFAKLLNMILTPTDGKIYIDGRDITSPEMTEDDIFAVRRDIGMVFQNPDNQLVATIVEEDVAFGPENLGVPPAEIRQRVNDALATVGMSEFAHRAPHRLSGGQKQRVAIAGIIAMMPRCIIFDESTAMLDPYGRAEVMATMEKLNRERGITVINITHHMDEAVRADRVIVMNDGKIFLDGTPGEVFSKVDELRFVGLDVPQGTELLHELDTLGFDFPEDCISPESCADLIAKKYKEIKGS